MADIKSLLETLSEKSKALTHDSGRWDSTQLAKKTKEVAELATQALTELASQEPSDAPELCVRIYKDSETNKIYAVLNEETPIDLTNVEPGASVEIPNSSYYTNQDIVLVDEDGYMVSVIQWVNPYVVIAADSGTASLAVEFLPDVEIPVGEIVIDNVRYSLYGSTGSFLAIEVQQNDSVL